MLLHESPQRYRDEGADFWEQADRVVQRPRPMALSPCSAQPIRLYCRP